MDCAQVEELLLDYVEGELDAEQSVAVRAHLASCQACCDYEDDLRATLDDLTVAANESLEVPADSVPGYQLIREIHRGGQGVVYQAVQESTRRKVAIKVMKEGPFSGPADQARFDREVQVLAQLNHPNIIAIHDTGVSAGCHYFVMDYISGRPLDRYIEVGERPVEETLRLAVKVCEAVNAAHLRGIIHRDLKPSNIRVDENGEPHILDFGLAKVATGDEASMMTMTGQFIGSLPWASPEQAIGQPGMIDLRTDVYSLGVILYHMLTGRFPYQVVGNMRDILDHIMHTEPTRPSTVRRQINEEVETIVLKCLSKERERRYQTAGELARDIKHYLGGEPIEAKRDSVGYVLRKHLRRYWVPTAIAAAFVLVVTAGFVTSLGFWQREVRHRETASLEAAKAEAVKDFLQRMLAAVDPEQARGREVTVRQILDDAARQIDRGSLGDEPEIEAEVRTTIGNTYMGLGLYDSAEPHLRTALRIRRGLFGERHVDTAGSMNYLGVLLVNRNEYDEAEPLYRRALAIRQELLGPEHTEIADSLNNLGGLLSRTGRFEEAEALLRESLAMFRRLVGADDPSMAHARNNLAAMLYRQGKCAEAEPLFRESLEVNRRLLGEDHPDVCKMACNLAAVRRDLGDYEAAEPLFREVLR
ncbi:MAG: tetratricopeptide repeat protein, partial [Phycisphaerales bacterium]